MQATIETLEGNRVKLSVEVGEEEYSRALDEALAEVAKTIRLPGFRPGHAPKRVVEARIGKEALRQEVLRDELPTYIRQAASDTGIDPIGSPEIEVTSEIGDSVLRFDAVVETRPRPPIPGYAGLRVTVPGPLATDEEIDRQIDRMREQATVQMRVAIDAFADMDPVKASALSDMDDAMDDLQRDLFRTIFTSTSPDEVGIQRAVQMALVGRFFERTADHAVSIGERVTYIVGWHD